MNLTKVTLATILLCLSYGITQAKRAIICGFVKDGVVKEVAAQYYNSAIDYADKKHTRVIAGIDKNDQYKLVFDIDHPISFNLSGTGTNGEDHYLIINKYLAPGDSLYLGFEADKITIDGNCEGCNGLLMAWESKFFKDPVVREERNNSDKMPLAEYLAYRQKDRLSQLNFYDVHTKGQPVPPDFNAYFHAEVNYDYAVDLLHYTWSHPEAMTDPSFRTSLAAIPVANASALNNDRYMNYLRELPYSTWRAFYYSHKKDTLLFKEISRRQYQIRDSVARMYLTGKLYDLALYSITREIPDGLKYAKGTPDFGMYYHRADSLLKQYEHSFSSPVYYARMQEILKSQRQTGPAVDFTLNDLNGEKVSLSDFKGKVVYVDFWATNCAPCVAELPHIKKLVEKYEGRNIAFLFVSLGDEKNKLTQYLKTKDFPGIHLIEPGGMGSEVAHHYNIASIPRYLLVDKNGELVSDDAPRPSSHPEAMIDAALAK